MNSKTLARLSRQLIAGLLLVIGTSIAQADWLHREAGVMGTVITVELYHSDEAVAARAAQAVIEEMKRIDRLMSPYIETSEVYRVNERAFSQQVPVSDELYALLKKSTAVSELTGGAFDITFASAGFYYDYRNSVRPDSDQLEELTRYIDFRNLVLDDGQREVRFSKQGVRIDLGGIAKGHAVDRCIEIIRSMGIESALVTAGGDSRMIGKRWNRPWHIGIRDPRDREKLVTMMPLENVAVSTSGDYERYFVEDGTRYHHIIDPESGDSARELRSVTVIGPDATTTDALSTSIFVLGLSGGLELANRLDGIDAVLVDSHGKMHYTDNLAPPSSL